MTRLTLAVIIGNRGFFPNHLCDKGRKVILKVLRRNGIDPVILEEGATACAGAVETLADARACAELFRRHSERIDGVLVTLPNFGDERGVAETLRRAGLNVPVLVHAFPDNSSRMTLRDRRDSFCGKISVCNNLRQYGIPFSLTAGHTMDPEGAKFAGELERFAAVCRVVKSLKNARFGMIGARPAAFNTVRFSEKLMEAAGMTVETVDLSEILGRCDRLKDSDKTLRAKLAALQAYTSTKGVASAALLRMARLGVVIDQWMQEHEISATALQCWTALEEYYGVVPCALMSMMSNRLVSSACETDITGLIGMHVLAAASGRCSALLDWNNNYDDDPDRGVLFHCSNLPKDCLRSSCMDYQAIIAGSVGKSNT
ncbi:MAG: fucose isomerase, partial [Lentisphaerae bacterium]|nr:fucose isomerase [Lentisphaerota bacterium]